LQSRDPFSGDCDSAVPGSGSSAPSSSCRAETRSQGIARGNENVPPMQFLYHHLAEPRPVLRGLRGRECESRSSGSRSTCRAETRSQGIARVARRGLLVAGHSACRAETRSQGIASRPHPGRLARRSEDACRAETRSQGIATPGLAGAEQNQRGNPCRAETRSQGIATAAAD
jgi:hypothetical protein